MVKMLILNVCYVFLRVLCRSMSLFEYDPFCHCALKLDLSTLFTTFFLSTYLQFIILVSVNIRN